MVHDIREAEIHPVSLSAQAVANLRVSAISAISVVNPCLLPTGDGNLKDRPVRRRAHGVIEALVARTRCLRIE